jgi:hypothetical protein
MCLKDESECDGGWRERYVRDYLLLKKILLLVKDWRSESDGMRIVVRRRENRNQTKDIVGEKEGRDIS